MKLQSSAHVLDRQGRGNAPEPERAFIQYIRGCKPNSRVG